MKKITIIGDSLGCGEWSSKLGKSLEGFYYREPTNKIETDSVSYHEVHPGVEHFLESDGHAVMNCSTGGSTNLTQLHFLEQSLMLRFPRHQFRFLNPDLIIWFYTEPMRDMVIFYGDHYFKGSNMHKDYVDQIKNRIEICGSDLKKINEEFIKISFENAERIYKSTKIPIILVEGLGMTHGIEKNYDIDLYKIENWVGRIVKSDVPMVVSSQIIEGLMEFMGQKFSTNQFEDLVSSSDKFISKFINNLDFPDAGHPSRHKHEELTKEIYESINWDW